MIVLTYVVVKSLLDFFVEIESPEFNVSLLYTFFSVLPYVLYNIYYKIIFRVLLLSNFLSKWFLLFLRNETPLLVKISIYSKFRKNI